MRYNNGVKERRVIPSVPRAGHRLAFTQHFSGSLVFRHGSSKAEQGIKSGRFVVPQGVQVAGSSPARVNTPTIPRTTERAGFHEDAVSLLPLPLQRAHTPGYHTRNKGTGQGHLHEPLTLTYT